MKQYAVVCIAVLVILLIFAAATNPDKQQYTSWAKDKVINHSEGGLGGVLLALTGSTILEGTTQYDNYFLFSVYKTKVFEDEITILGAFNNFFEIGSSLEKLNHIESVAK